MSFALSVLDLAPVGSGSTSSQALRNTVELARLAERLGYTRFWLAEHATERMAFEEISLDHLGDPATVTVLTPGFSAPEATALPLIGIVMDRSEDGDIAVMLGTPDGAHLSRVVPRPVEVQMDRRRSPARTRLLMRSADGTTTLVEVARPVGAMLEAMAAANVQF